jgi:hypothetical protein
VLSACSECKEDLSTFASVICTKCVDTAKLNAGKCLLVPTTTDNTKVCQPGEFAVSLKISSQTTNTSSSTNTGTTTGTGTENYITVV